MSIESTLSKFGKHLDILLLNIKRITGGTLSSLARANQSKRKSINSAKPGNHSSATRSPYLILVFDSFIAFLSILVSIHLRIGMDFSEYSQIYIFKNMFVFSLVSSSVFLWFQIYQSFWRYTAVEDLVSIFFSSTLSNIVFFPLMLLMNQENFFPYSLLIINTLVLSLMLILPRFLTKVLYDHRLKRTKKFDALEKRMGRLSNTSKVLLVGASASVESFFREVISNEDVIFDFDAVGILTLDQSDVGRIIKGIPILGELRNIHDILRTLSKEEVFPKQVVITEKFLSESAKKFLVKYTQEHGLLLLHAIFQCTLNAVEK
ncbi:MAG: hypothetical protein LBI95_00940 [Holosporales bacterium]|jgi:FlaA1/EpsC-like NDP-sugar epimerase|nr:hypothetical protein [Holosporales bacterium]